jgi:hypothetical protein
MTKTASDLKEENKRKMIAFLEDAQRYHKNVLDRLGVSMQQFSVKPGWFLPKSKSIPSIPANERVIGLFPNECQKGFDLYMELYDMDKNPLEGRPLYKWKYNPHYAEELAEYYNENSGQMSYIIPVSELTLIDQQNALINNVEDPFDLFESNKSTLSTKMVSKEPVKVAHVEAPRTNGSVMDRNVSELSVRELFAIVNRKPMSGNRELDNYILSFIN